MQVKVKNVDEVLSFKELSEGEQQLLTLLWLLKFTGSKDSLFLLDEPDTHLNPSWTVDYFKFLGQFTSNKESTQIILATHHPLAITELKKEQVKIMWKDENQKVFASEPINDPVGMGYAGLLTSDLFGLRSDLDSKTLQLLDEHTILLAKNNLTITENNRFSILKDELNKCGFLEAYSDPYFAAFVKAWMHKEEVNKTQKRILSKEDRSDNPIDHFRPKNKVVECDGHPGYWWLAFDWRNYRFTCTYCNSRRVNIETAGAKHDHFPLLQPAIWDMCETDCNNEKPTLLDPCDIDDCSLLTFNINDYASVITDDETLEEYIRAVRSIELYHLNYNPTKRARKIIYFKIRKLVTDINELINRGISENLDQIKAKKKNL